LIEQILNPRNLQRALRQVIANDGSAGIDGMKTSHLTMFFRKHRSLIMQEIRDHKYLPQPIMGVEIPKGKDKTRLLGIPTVIDRLLQQAVSQTIMLRFDEEFSVNSYGFRPGKNAHQAVCKALEYIHDSYTYIVDIDLKNFFDEVDHCLLLNLVYQKVKCPTTMRLVRKWLRAPILIDGELIKRRKGVPQGSPLSPLLSNILLHELDKELVKRGLKFVRYADDFSVYVKDKIEARKIGNSIYVYLRDKLKLPINREKSGIRKPVQFTLLGFRFVPTYIKGDKGKYQLIVSDKAWLRLKRSLKAITRKTSPLSFDERIGKIKEIQRGWLNYFRGANIFTKLRELDGWVRNRLRYCIWHDWKKSERKRRNLIRLGVEKGLAYAWSRSRMGGWAIAQSPILGTTITIQRLKKRLYESMLDVYFRINPSLHEPPYTRPVRTVV
jgi:RNA-directed DNA polymerase